MVKTKKVFAEVALAISVAAMMRVSMLAEKGETIEDATRRIITRSISNGRATRAFTIRSGRCTRITFDGLIHI